MNIRHMESIIKRMKVHELERLALTNDECKTILQSSDFIKQLFRERFKHKTPPDHCTLETLIDEHISCLQTAKECADDVYFIYTKKDAMEAFSSHPEVSDFKEYNIILSRGPLQSNVFGKTTMAHYNAASLYKSGDAFKKMRQLCDKKNVEFQNEHRFEVWKKEDFKDEYIEIQTREFAWAVVEMKPHNVPNHDWHTQWHRSGEEIIFIYGCFLCEKMARMHLHFLQHPYKLYDLQSYTNVFPNNVSSDLYHIMYYYYDVHKPEFLSEIVCGFSSLEEAENECFRYQEMEMKRTVSYALTAFFGDYILQLFDAIVHDYSIYNHVFDMDTKDEDFRYTKLVSVLRPYFAKFKKEESNGFKGYAEMYVWIKKMIFFPLLRELICTFSMREFLTIIVVPVSSKIITRFRKEHADVLRAIDDGTDESIVVDVRGDFMDVHGVPYTKHRESSVPYEDAYRKAVKNKKVATLIANTEYMMEEIYAAILLKQGNLPDKWSLRKADDVFKPHFEQFLGP
jgi:hypothetical protein